MTDIDALKKTIEESATGTLGDLWNAEEDKKFLGYNAEKLAKYAIRLRTAETDEDRKEAQFNIDMLKTSLAAYVYQKQIMAAHKVEEVIPKVVALVVRIIVAAV
jgi:hypothetical protein